MRSKGVPQGSEWDVPWDGMGRQCFKICKEGRPVEPLFRPDSIKCLSSVSVKVIVFDVLSFQQFILAFQKYFWYAD